MTRLFRRRFLLDLQQRHDELEHVVPLRHAPLFWPLMFTVSFALAALLAWGFLTRVPVHVEARGLVMHLGGVREIAALGEGIVVSSIGGERTKVAAGDVILKVSHPLHEAAYAEARMLYLQDAAVIAKERQAVTEKYENQLRLLNTQLANVRVNLATLRPLSAEFHAAIGEFDKIQKDLLTAEEGATSSLEETYDRVQKAMRGLLDHQRATRSAYAQVEQARTLALQSHSETAINIARAPIEKQRMLRELSEVDEKIAADTAHEQELTNNIQDLRNQEQIEHGNLNTREVKSRSSLLDQERKVWVMSNLFTPYEGEVIALKKAVGQTVTTNESVALLNMVSQSSKRMLVISPRAVSGHLRLSLGQESVEIPFRNGDVEALRTDVSKALATLAPGGQFLLHTEERRVVIGETRPTPSREGEGTLDRLQLADFALFDSEGAPVFAMFLAIGDEWRAGDLVAVALLRPEDGKKVHPDQPALIKPDYEETLVGAQIEASVDSVSSYAATPLEAQALIGSAELARVVSGNATAVAAILHFKRDSAGRLLLHGGDLHAPLTVGTTVRIRIHVDTVPPVVVLLPFLARPFN